MKKLILLTAMLISCLELNAQQIKYPYSMPGPEGIYIMCGNEIPREISYSIYRMKNGDKDWEYLTTLSFNTNMRIDDFFKQLELINAKNSINNLYNLSAGTYTAVVAVGKDVVVRKFIKQ